MATMNVKDATGATVAIEKPLAPGRAAAAASRPVALSSEDKTALDAVSSVLGAKTAAAMTETDATETPAMSVWKQISKSVQAIATGISGKVKVSDGTNDASVRAGASLAVKTDAALVVTMRPDSLDDIFGEYETVAASATDQVMGAVGGAGDYLSGVLIIPAAAGCGAVSVKDGAGSGITIFAGGGTTALPTLAPIFVPLGIYSKDGAWKVTTGANVSAIGIGKFKNA
jgi:hypothetical protein